MPRLSGNLTPSMKQNDDETDMFSNKKYRGKKALDDADAFAMNARMFAYLIKDGYSVAVAVRLLSEQAEGIFKQPMKQVEKDILAGVPIARAFGATGFFPAEFASVIGVGEKSGMLDVALEKYCDYVESVITAKKSFETALRYPTIIMAFALIMGLALIIFVVPTIKETVSGMHIDPAAIPTTGKFLFFLHDSISILGNTGAMIIVGFVSWYLVFGSGKKHIVKALSAFPKVRKLEQTLIWAQWLIMGGICLKSGMLVDQMLDVMGKVVLPREFTKKKGFYDEMRLNVRKGRTLSSEMKRGNAPSMITSMIGVAEKSGRVNDVMDAIGCQMIGIVPYEIKNVSAFLEPLVVAMVTAIGGGVAGAVIHTLMSVSAAIGG